jgi:hypothetical protein
MCCSGVLAYALFDNANFQKDRERATYGFKETTLAKAFIHAFGLNEKSVDAQSLLNWRKPDQSDVGLGPCFIHLVLVYLFI